MSYIPFLNAIKFAGAGLVFSLIIISKYDITSVLLALFSCGICFIIADSISCCPATYIPSLYKCNWLFILTMWWLFFKNTANLSNKNDEPLKNTGFANASSRIMTSTSSSVNGSFKTYLLISFIVSLASSFEKSFACKVNI